MADFVSKVAGSITGGGGFSEVGTVTHRGQSFGAFGSSYDPVSGTLVGYAKRAPGGQWTLSSWEGQPICPLKHTGSWRGGFGRETMHSFSCVYDGRKFTGRNTGEEMLLRMKARAR